MQVNLKVNHPYKKFPPKPIKKELDMGLREEMIRQAVERIQPRNFRH